MVQTGSVFETHLSKAVCIPQQEYRQGTTECVKPDSHTCGQWLLSAGTGGRPPTQPCFRACSKPWEGGGHYTWLQGNFYCIDLGSNWIVFTPCFYFVLLQSLCLPCLGTFLFFSIKRKQMAYLVLVLIYFQTNE